MTKVLSTSESQKGRRVMQMGLLSVANLANELAPGCSWNEKQCSWDEKRRFQCLMKS